MNATAWQKKRLDGIAARILDLIKERRLERYEKTKVIIVPRGVLPDVDQLWGVPVLREDEVLHVSGKDLW